VFIKSGFSAILLISHIQPVSVSSDESLQVFHETETYYGEQYLLNNFILLHNEHLYVENNF